MTCHTHRPPSLAAALGLAFALALSLGLSAQGALAAPDGTVGTTNEAATIPGEAILLFDNAADAQHLLSSAERTSELDATVIASDLAGQTAVSVDCGSEREAETLIDAANALPGVVAQPNYVYEFMDVVANSDEASTAAQAPAASTLASAASPNDPLAKDQYHLGALGDGTGASGVNALEAWELARSQSQRSNITVAVLDSGADLEHEDLQATMRKDLVYDVTTASPTMSDAVGHGTAVSGVIGATTNNELGVAGVGSGANSAGGSGSDPVQILPVNVFGTSNKTATSNIVKGLTYLDGLVESGQLNNLKVINMSFGVYATANDPNDTALHEAVRHITNEHGVLCVGAGGNGNGKDTPKTAPCYPADYEECLSVTGLTVNGANAPWSDYNAAKDISAPAVNILTTGRTQANQSSENNYKTMNGTSLATPIVSSVAALMFSVDSELSPSEAIEIIRQSAADLPDPTTNDRGDAMGSAGALDARAALAQVIEQAGKDEPGPDEDNPTPPNETDNPTTQPPGSLDNPGNTDDPSSNNPGNEDEERSIAVWRLYNKYDHTHLYTTDETEVKTNTELGWQNEGVLWYAPAEERDGNYVIVRLFNPYSGDHYYLPQTNTQELKGLLDSGWQEDSKSSWILSAPAKSAYPVYTLFNPYRDVDTHLYTPNEAEARENESLGWKPNDTVIWAASLPPRTEG